MTRRRRRHVVIGKNDARRIDDHARAAPGTSVAASSACSGNSLKKFRICGIFEHIAERRAIETERHLLSLIPFRVVAFGIVRRLGDHRGIGDHHDAGQDFFGRLAEGLRQRLGKVTGDAGRHFTVAGMARRCWADAGGALLRIPGRGVVGLSSCIDGHARANHTESRHDGNQAASGSPLCLLPPLTHDSDLLYGCFVRHNPRRGYRRVSHCTRRPSGRLYREGCRRRGDLAARFVQ